MTTRIDQTFARLKAANSTAFVGYIMGGDPDLAKSQALLNALPSAAVDIIELGMPFTDPAADGLVIEDAGLRSLKAGTTVETIFAMVRAFRRTDQVTPIIVMGYANPVHHMGYAEFSKTAKEAGIDGAIIVDLPPEEDADLRTAFEAHDLALIRLATPTTDDARLPKVVEGTKGFVYYVSVAGITGSQSGENQAIEQAVTRIRTAANLPVVVGFGIKTPDQAQAVAKHADGVVVGSAIVKSFHEHGLGPTTELVKSLAKAAHGD